MIEQSTKWVDAFSVAGISVGMVFVILVLLVLVLVAFNYVAQLAEAAAPKKADPIKASARKDGADTSMAELMEHDKVAIATALYMYYNDMHDNESGVLTIHHNDHSGWNLQLGN